MRGFDGIWPPVCVQGQGKGDDLERSRSVWGNPVEGQDSGNTRHCLLKQLTPLCETERLHALWK